MVFQKIIFNKIAARITLSFLTVFTLFALLSCKSENIEITKTSLSMGTFVQIDIVSSNKLQSKANKVIEEAFKKIHNYDKKFDYRKNGSLKLFNSSGALKKTEFPELYSLIQQSIKIAQLTEGAFDPTIYPLVKLWGFDDGHPSLPQNSNIQEAVKKVDYKKIKIQNGKITKPPRLMLDLSAIAKGKIVDIIGDFIKSEGFTNFLINAGGDIYASGLNKKHSKWKIAIQDPFNPEKYSGILNLTNSAVVTSGDYENFFIKDGKKYCHIINPKTGYPPFNMHSVTIISDNTAFADAVATAVFVMGPEKGFNFLKTKNIKGLIIYTDENNKIVYEATKNFWK